MDSENRPRTHLEHTEPTYNTENLLRIHEQSTWKHLSLNPGTTSLASLAISETEQLILISPRKPSSPQFGAPVARTPMNYLRVRNMRSTVHGVMPWTANLSLTT